MMSKIRTNPPSTCEECEFYTPNTGMHGLFHGTCQHFKRPVSRRLRVCDSRLSWNRVQIRAYMIAASTPNTTPRKRRPKNDHPRQDNLL